MSASVNPAGIPAVEADSGQFATASSLRLLDPAEFQERPHRIVCQLPEISTGLLVQALMLGIEAASRFCK
jgi:hypothetical protein